MTMTWSKPPNRADQPFRERILPRRARGCEDFLDAHDARAPRAEVLAVAAVAVADEVLWRGVKGERLAELLPNPGGVRVGGDIDVDDPPAIVAQDHEAIQKLDSHGGHDEEVDAHQRTDVVIEEVAVKWQHKTLEDAAWEKQNGAESRKRLELYKQKKAYRQE